MAGAPAVEAQPVAVIACGALGGHLREISARRGWDVEIVCLPSMLHNSPRQITPAAERLATGLQAAGKRVVLAYADCGTYGELDRLCERLGLARLPGLHCYDVFAGPERIRAALEAEPGTYLLTDFLVRSFRYSVLEPLGLDSHPELWPDYFGHYRRLVWLAQSPGPALAMQAERVAEMFGLPLTVIDVGTDRLERELESLLAGSGGSRGGATGTGSDGGSVGDAGSAAGVSGARADRPLEVRVTRKLKTYRPIEPLSLQRRAPAPTPQSQKPLLSHQQQER